MMWFRDIDFSYLIPCIDGFRTVTIESNNYPKWKDLACYDQNTCKKLIFSKKKYKIKSLLIVCHVFIALQQILHLFLDLPPLYKWIKK
jgi:hypothetical protein